MGWFDRQVREIKKKDQEVFEDSIFQMASVVLGKRDSAEAADERILTKAAIDEILKYYHYKPVEIPGQLKDADEQMEYCLRPKGIMYRKAELKEGWYKESFLPFLATAKEDNRPVALIPQKTTGYRIYDPVSGKSCKANKKTAEGFKKEAVCFYKPLPLKSLGKKDLLSYMMSYLTARDISAYVILALMVTLVGMLSPMLTRALTGRFLLNGNYQFLIGIAVFLVCAAVSAMLMNSVRSLLLDRMKTKPSQALEAALMARVMNLPTGFFREYSSGELANRLSFTNQLGRLIFGSLFSKGVSAFVSLLYIAQIVKYAPGLTVPAVIIIAVTFFVNIMTTIVQTKVKKAEMEAAAQSSGISFAMINGVQKIKLAGAEKRAFAKWAASYSKEAKRAYDLPVFLKANAAITTAVSLLGTIAIYYLAVATGVSPSEYLAFNVAYGSVTGAISTLSDLAKWVSQIKPILEMIEPVLKAVPEASENKKVVTSLSGNIELNQVYFRYNENMPYVINGLSLKIRSGEYIAIVGTTGCGKSTLMRILLGFETPERGAVYYDGSDMSKLDLKSLRQKIGVVMQDGGLFQGDIFSNITISAPQLTLDEAWEAAELAGIADDIRDMPMGMGTLISEGQGGISGGQKQRLMIARAIAPKPKILMFDEATSALDNKTQKMVSESLAGLKCTRIVIAHRLSTIRHCDRILVLDKGEIKEDGTYDELIAKGGLFAGLVERQRIE